MRRVLASRRLNFRTKFAVRSMLGNPMRSFVVLLGVFLGSFIILLGQGFFDSIDRMGTVAADTLGSFEHEYILTNYWKTILTAVKRCWFLPWKMKTELLFL